jgi:hypothetical protein
MGVGQTTLSLPAKTGQKIPCCGGKTNKNQKKALNVPQFWQTGVSFAYFAQN